MDVKNLCIQLPILGKVTSVNEPEGGFTVETRNGTTFAVHVKPTTWVDTVTNLDRLGRYRAPLVPPTAETERPKAAAENRSPNVPTGYNVGDLIGVEGTLYINGASEYYEAMAVHSLKSHKGMYLFEHTSWWKTQIEALADKWLDVLFGEKRTYAVDDFSALYRTTLNIEGMPTDDSTQEMATLSRLIYGLSSAYLVGGDERYFLAAQAGVRYQLETFRSTSTDGRFEFWVHARKKDRHGVYQSLPSLNAEDSGTLPCYEQIYALAGLAQFYRIANDREVLDAIHGTLRMFEAIFADKRETGNGLGHNGYFSHVDPVTFSWDDPRLEHVGPDGVNNRARKNWNSVGDHLPAYLINLILSLDPAPKAIDDPDSSHAALLDKILKMAEQILLVTSGLIRDHFPDAASQYVNERFTRDWEPVHDWGWQRNRAVVGHNLKIAWNLTRVANYHRSKGRDEEAETFAKLAHEIGEKMKTYGLDGIRSGVYDAVERAPHESLEVQFAWRNTKDFWQQEQGILAYLILFGYPGDPLNPQTTKDFHMAATELSAFWNLYFLDRERNGVFFRISDNGYPVIESTYGDKGGHSISGYHTFELAYLAHVYQLAYLPRAQRQHTAFCLHFRPSVESGIASINVLPDFLGPGALELFGVEIDGIPRKLTDAEHSSMRIDLRPGDLGRHVKVFLRQGEAAFYRLSPQAVPDDTLPST